MDAKRLEYANRHLLKAQLALAKVEEFGVRIDAGYCDAAVEKIGRDAEEMARRVKGTELWREWVKAHGDKANLGSRDQMADVVFNRLGYPSIGRTESGRPLATKEAFAHVDLGGVADLLRMDQLKKAASTWLKGIRRAAIEDGDGNWVVHPSINLNTAVTFRSSITEPALQNIPIRDPEIMRVIRAAFIPRRGNHFPEPDYAQAEVRVAACYNKDPALIKYIEDKSADMHRDAAADIFRIKKSEVSKDARHAAKNQYVFPQFYGSVYFQCAPALWDAMTRRKMALPDGTPLRRHLKRLGVTELGDCAPKAQNGPHTFVAHMKSVEEKFWNRLKVYRQWKYDWWDRYQREGWMQSFFGFVWRGHHKRNDILNYVIQCDAFHCLLWSLIRVVNWLTKNKMKAMVVNQIHDSMQLDVPPREMDDVLNKVHEVMTADLRREHDWLVVPMETECEVPARDRPWSEKVSWVADDGGHWGPK